MKTLIAIGTAAAALAPATALAAPVYLECGLNLGDRVQVWNITANEESSQVSWTIPADGVASSARAIFTAESVRWQIVAGIRVTFTLNRVDLSFTRQFGEGNDVSRGQCRLAPRRARAF